MAQSEPQSETENTDSEGNLQERVEELESQLAQEEAAEREALEAERAEEEDNDEEPKEVEVVEAGGETLPEVPSKIELAESTYSAKFGEYIFQLIPLNTSQGIVWEGRVLRKGSSGPILQKRWPEKLTDAEAEELGVPEGVQRDFNDALDFLSEEVKLSQTIEGPRESRSFRDLDQLRRVWENATGGNE